MEKFRGKGFQGFTGWGVEGDLLVLPLPLPLPCALQDLPLKMNLPVCSKAFRWKGFGRRISKVLGGRGVKVSSTSREMKVRPFVSID